MNNKTETIAIEGMSCGHCVASVKQALSEIEGVEVEQVDIGSARISYDATVVNHSAIDQAIENAGFDVCETQGVS